MKKKKKKKNRTCMHVVIALVLYYSPAWAWAGESICDGFCKNPMGCFWAIGAFYPRNRRVPRELLCKITIESSEIEAEPVYRIKAIIKADTQQTRIGVISTNGTFHWKLFRCVLILVANGSAYHWYQRTIG